MNAGELWDAEEYCRMARQVSHGQAISAAKPFVYEIALPTLVGLFHREHVIPIFKIFNFLFGIFTVYWFIKFLRLLFPERIILYILVLLFITNLSSPVRFPSAYPAYTDPAHYFFSILILYLSYKWEKLSASKTLLLCLLAFFGCLFREVVIIAPIAGVFAHRIRLAYSRNWIDIPSRKQLFMSLAPILCALLAILTTHLIVKPTGDFLFLPFALQCAKNFIKRPLRYVLSLLIAFGPVFLITLFANMSLAKELIKNQMLLAYGAGVALVAFIGGYHTERFFFWAYVVFLPIIGWAIRYMQCESRRIRVLMFLAFMVFQVIGHRIFMGIPPIYFLPSPERPQYFVLAPYGRDIHYHQMSTDAMSKPLKKLYLAQYGGLALATLGVRWICSGNRKKQQAIQFGT